jgi:hypothetical protein
MVIPARPAFGMLLAIELGFVAMEGASAVRGSASAARSTPIGLAPVSSTDLAKGMPGVPAWRMLVQADDLAPPPPNAMVTTPPPAPLAETPPPPPFPGYAWDPGHWAWDGAQYVWEPGRYIVQPTNGATFTPGYWQQYSGGWAWVDSRWSWGTQGEGE